MRSFSLKFIFSLGIFLLAGMPLSASFRVSDMGPASDANFDASQVAAAFNTTNNEYMVVWVGENAVNGNFEIFGQRLNGTTGAEVGINDFPISANVPDGVPLSDIDPAVAYNSANNQYLVVWMGAITPGATEYEIYGQRLDGATGAEIGAGDFRISDMGLNGNTAFAAAEPAVCYNATQNEFLVVWRGDDVVDEKFEIHGQRINALTGAETGTNDFMIGDGVDDPTCAFNSINNQYLVVWQGTVAPTTADFEIYGQRLNGINGASLGTKIRLSDMGPEGDANKWWASSPDVAYNPTVNEFLVVWQGDDVTGLDVFEIYGQRLNAATGGEVGSNDFMISDMSLVSNLYSAYAPAVQYNAINEEYFVAWHGNKDSQTDAIYEMEIYGQRLKGATGVEIGADDFRLSFMGPPDDIDYPALTPDVAFNQVRNEYLAVWEGSDNKGNLVKGEFEIFGEITVPLRVLTIVPGFDNIRGGATVTVTGNNFEAGTSLVIGSQTATNITIVSPTVITAVVPPNTAGKKDVEVVNPDSAMSRLIGGFKYRDIDLQFKAAFFEVDEGGVQATITVERKGEVEGPASVQYATSDGSAAAGADYLAASGPLQWADNDGTDKTFTVSINDDGIPEGEEFLNLTLSNPTGGAAIGGTNPVRLAILDNEKFFQFMANSLSVNENGTQVDVVVRYFGTPGTGGASVRIQTQNGTALAGTDYTAHNSLLTWLKGDPVIKQITIPILNDDIYEEDETFFVRLSSPTAGDQILTPNPLPVTILNDEEPAGTLDLTGGNQVVVRENKGTMTVDIFRSEGTRGTIQVPYRTTEISAKNNEDFIMTQGTVSFAAGQDTGSFDITIVDDSVPELQKSFLIEIHSPQFEKGGGKLGSQVSQVVIVNSDDIPEFTLNGQTQIHAGGKLLFGSLALQSAGNLSVHWGKTNTDPSIQFEKPNELETNVTFTQSGTFLVPLFASVGYEYIQVGQIQVQVTDLALASLPPSKNLFNTSKNESAVIQLVMNKDGNLTVDIYDRLGKKIRELVNGAYATGFYTEEWNGRDSDGEEVAPGLYIAIIKEADNTRKLKLIVLN